MADYSSMKVPELKKLLSERGLPHTGNKADLIARLQENDKQQAASTAEPQADSKPPAAEDEIDYDDDDFPALNKDNKDAAAGQSAAVNADKSAPATTAATTEPKKADGAAAAAPTEPKQEPAAVEGADKTAAAAAAETESAAEPAAPLFTQNLPPTNAQTEAEKRAARAARFGISADTQSDEAKKAARAARFGVANDQVSALDSALPDRAARKRGRGGGGGGDDGKEEGGENPRASKRSNRNEGGGGAGGRNQQRGRGGRRRGGGRDQNRGGGAPQKGGKGYTSATVDPAEKAKMEARAKRFA
ncbi:SAP domain-containing protein [Madurella fahalii]|uniref:SAP domain-containing protein n=1 Tax=Madurella fahalii TaxID=1157608 RepID=A0ABQ0GAR5_9PEZI